MSVYDFFRLRHSHVPGRPVVILLVLLCLLLPVSSWAGLSHAAHLKWKTLHSDHFKVHFHQGEEELARQAAGIAEKVHRKLSPVFHWQPKSRTDIILSDELGISNGYATPFPTNRSGIYVSPPDSLNSLEDHDGWLETVITHEYVHILHLDKAKGAPAVFRKIFGRYGGALPFTVFPNAMQPGWLIEGLATYYETDTQRGIGRGQSSYFDMLMRMEVDAGVKSVRQVNQPIVSWPGATSRYLYGVHFYNFVAEKKGKKYIQAMVEDYSSDWFPFRVNSNTEDTFGLGQGALWNEYKDYLEKKYQPTLRRIRKEGVRAGQPLTEHGYSTGAVRVTENGTVYYLRNDWQSYPALMVIKPGDKPRHLVDVNPGSRFDVDTQSGILLAQAELCRNAQLYFDLYRVSANGRKSRLTKCGRYHYASWLPGGKELIAAKLELGRSSLEQLNAEGAHIKTLWTATAGEVIGGLDISADGKSLAAALWRPGKGWNLELFSIATQHWRALTRDRQIEMQPQFSADGRSVWFTSDHGGVYNARRMDLVSGKMHTFTNVLGGAFHPAPDAEGKTLYYTGFDADGFDIYRLNLNQGKATATGKPQRAQANTESETLGKTRISSYSPWSTVAPQWWFPHLVLDDAAVEVGVVTSGWDVLQRHTYVLDAAYDVTNKWPVGSFNYLYDRWWPLLKLHASRFNDVDREKNIDDDLEPIRVRRNDTFLGELIFPLLRFDRGITLHAGALRLRESDGWVEDGIAEKPEEIDNLAGVAAMYSSVKQYRRAISRSDGRSVRLVAESSEVIEGGDYTGSIYTLDWREYFKLWGEHVLAVRFVEGWGDESPRPFELGGSSTADGLPLPGGNLVYSPFGRREYALRGYRSGLRELEGRRMQLGSLEYRFPILRLERGITIPPVGLHQLHGTVFVDSGGIWDTDDSQPDKYYTGLGAEVTVEVVLFYGVTLPLRLGVARGLDSDLGSTEAYLQLGASF
ncbi:MAG: hypothetical protein BMS9Abin36_0652 [Gammaproteobacteria bacterium]|nr:MAG: hypothetical protein BMS9Abin36_0652 [Gammaproteobacteria bacterium]